VDELQVGGITLHDAIHHSRAAFERIAVRSLMRDLIYDLYSNAHYKTPPTTKIFGFLYFVFLIDISR
jgi:hypothetical protein